MSKFDELNTEMTIGDAEIYLQGIFEELENIYSLKEAPSGKAGTVWRIIWGRPRKLTPMSYFLAYKIQDEIDRGKDLAKEKYQKAKNNTAKKFKQTIEDISNKYEEIAQQNEAILDEKDDLQSKLEKEQAEHRYAQSILRHYEAKESAEENPIMTKALINDVRMLFEIARKYQNIALDDLQSHRLSKK
jgi:hypothetical protein